MKLVLLIATTFVAVASAALDPPDGNYESTWGPILLFPFQQQECGAPNKIFTSAVLANTGFGVLQKGATTTIACPKVVTDFGETDNAVNGVILTNDVSGENAGLISSGNYGDSEFAERICLQTTNVDGKEVCEGENIQFAAEFWFDYQTDVTFPDTTSRFVFLEISDATDVFFQIAYSAGAGGQFQISWNSGLAVAPFTDFEEGLNHVVFRIEGATRTGYSNVIVNNGASIESPFSSSPTQFTNNAKLRIGDGITHSNFKTAIHHVALYKREAYVASQFANLALGLYTRNISNSYPVSKSVIYVVVEEDANLADISEIFSPENFFDFDGAQTFELTLLQAPNGDSELFPDGSNTAVAVEDVMVTGLQFKANAPANTKTVDSADECDGSTGTTYSGFLVRARDEYGEFDLGTAASNVAVVNVCILNVPDAPVPTSGTESVRYGTKEKVSITFEDVDGGVGDGYEVQFKSISITPGDVPKLTTVGNDGLCTSTEIVVNGDFVPAVGTDGGGKLDFCIESQTTAQDVDLSQPIIQTGELNWVVKQGSVPQDSTEGVLTIQFTNPIEVCPENSPCDDNTADEVTVPIDGSALENTDGKAFQVFMDDASAIGNPPAGDYKFVLSEAPAHGKIFISGTDNEVAKGDEVDLTTFAGTKGTSVELVYIPNENYFNQIATSGAARFKNFHGEGFFGCEELENGCPDIAKFSAKRGERQSPMADVRFFVTGVPSQPTQSNFVLSAANVTVEAGVDFPFKRDNVPLVQYDDPDQDTVKKSLTLTYSNAKILYDPENPPYSEGNLLDTNNIVNCQFNGCDSFDIVGTPTALNYVLREAVFRASRSENVVVTFKILSSTGQGTQAQTRVTFLIDGGSTDTSSLSDVVLAVIIAAAGIVGCVFLSATALVLSKARQGGIAAKHALDHQLGRNVVHDSDVDSDDEEMGKAHKKKKKKAKKTRPSHDRNSKAIGKYKGDEELEVKDDSIFDWEKHIDRKTGDVYFFNPKTGESRWDPPTVKASAVARRR